MSMVHWCCKTIGLKRLLAEAWPDNRPFVSILVELGLNELLAEALKTEEGKASLQSATSQGATPLHAAARYHNVEAARLILGCDDEQDSLRMKPDKTEALAIHYAANAGADDIAGLLLARKGKEQRLAWGGKPACLPIHRVTAGSGNGALVRRLLKDCAVEQVTAQIGPSRATPLHLAVFYRSVELVRILLGVTAALPQQLTLPDSKGRRPIDIARANGDQEIIALLEAAMKDLPETASSSTASGSTTSTASTTTTTATTNDGPVPLTPYPATPFAPEADDIEEAFEVSDPY
jgi:ankyrin repeat protein